MQFAPTELPEVVLVTTSRHTDDRGWFARSWCAQEFREAGLPDLTAQANLSWNVHAHTLRGMHWQAAPSQEAKLVRPVQGAIWDVAVDVRPHSPTKGEWVGVQLRATEAEALLVPAGFAHGFLTLEPNTLVHYHMGDVHQPDLARGFPWNDPDVGIDWPHAPQVLSDRDARLTPWKAQST